MEEKETEKLKEIDLSLLAQPSIRKAKKDSKNQRLKEIESDLETLSTKKEELNKRFNLPSTQQKENQKDEPKRMKDSNVKREEKHIDMMTDRQNYDISQDLNSMSPNISFGQLLDLSPKLRAQLNKALKYRKRRSYRESSIITDLQRRYCYM